MGCSNSYSSQISIIGPPSQQFRTGLDAYYARLYGLTRDELRYTPCGVDPKEIYGEDFPGETVRVVKAKEIKQFGEYRTSRLVLEAWDKLEK